MYFGCASPACSLTLPLCTFAPSSRTGRVSRLADDARALTEGGLQSLPRLASWAGRSLGALSADIRLVLCGTSVINTAKIKDTHSAMRVHVLPFSQLTPAHRCAAGVVNTAQIKGTHNVIRTGILTAKAIFAARFLSTANLGTLKAEVGETDPIEQVIFFLGRAQRVPRSQHALEADDGRSVAPGAFSSLSLDM
ncbi:hypothetical protein K438DRAFT_1982114 [Mycena galopus ATCC 62051]|nr:hypothetical protein K438DRAFT_1982114 [Mycena galopus ATCC 62051]